MTEVSSVGVERSSANPKKTMVIVWSKAVLIMEGAFSSTAPDSPQAAVIPRPTHLKNQWRSLLCRLRLRVRPPAGMATKELVC
jgi:hypothetical protein